MARYESRIMGLTSARTLEEAVKLYSEEDGVSLRDIRISTPVGSVSCAYVAFECDGDADAISIDGRTFAIVPDGACVDDPDEPSDGARCLRCDAPMTDAEYDDNHGVCCQGDERDE